MDIGLIVVGDEILSGKRADKHLAKVVELLGARGQVLSWARFVGDERPRLTAALREAFANGDLVLCCGGIGATPDDHTRQCAAAALGVALEPHAQAQALIVQRMREVAAERGQPYEPDAPDQVHRLNMGCLPAGATLIPNPFNRIAGFSLGRVHFVPGFPVMAWPMIEWVLDQHAAELQSQPPVRERSVIVRGAIEARLTPLMEDIEARFEGVKVFSLPSVDHPQWGRHVELGVKSRGDPAPAYAALREGLDRLGAALGPELVR
jgi:molybdopterin-biosynthesis enzyme MoeA-like protein